MHCEIDKTTSLSLPPSLPPPSYLAPYSIILILVYVIMQSIYPSPHTSRTFHEIWPRWLLLRTLQSLLTVFDETSFLLFVAPSPSLSSPDSCAVMYAHCPWDLLIFLPIFIPWDDTSMEYSVPHVALQFVMYSCVLSTLLYVRTSYVVRRTALYVLQNRIRISGSPFSMQPAPTVNTDHAVIQYRRRYRTPMTIFDIRFTTADERGNSREDGYLQG